VSGEYIDDWTTPNEVVLDIQPMERHNKQSNIEEKPDTAQKAQNKKEVFDDEDEDADDVENAISRSSVRVGLPTQSVGSRQARKLQTLLEGVNPYEDSEYMWQAFVIQIPENATHLDVEQTLRRALQIPDSLKSNYSVYPKSSKNFFLDPDKEDEDEGTHNSN